jgi:hypothetical protein
MKKFEDTLKAALNKGMGNCIRIVLKSGKEYWGAVKEIGGDYFTLVVTYTGGGREDIVIRIGEVASFSDR